MSCDIVGAVVAGLAVAFVEVVVLSAVDPEAVVAAVAVLVAR